MNYELAKELKDAGFPQLFQEASKHLYWNTGAKGPCPMPDQHGDLSLLEACRIPTLSELIEACGEGFGAMERYLVGETKLDSPARSPLFIVGNYINRDGEIEGHRCEAFTPEEAVARLWLALNKK